MATITEICNDSPWWYMSCSCMKSVTQQGVTYFCKDCNTHMFHAIPRYELKLKVCDGEESAKLVLFDGEAVALLDKSCEDMVLQSKVESNSSIPEEIYVLIGKEVVFVVEKNFESATSLDGSLKVQSICSEPVLISEYREYLHEETPLKLKFAPFFQKDGSAEGCSGTKEIKIESNSVLTKIDLSPLSCGQPCGTPEAESVSSKRGMVASINPPPERKKRAKVKPIKFE